MVYCLRAAMIFFGVWLMGVVREWFVIDNTMCIDVSRD